VCSQVVPAIIDIFKNIPADSLSFLADIWTSRAGESILGTRCHYIDSNWELFSRSIGFQQFPERYTGDNIRNKFKILLESFGSTIDRVTHVI
jgi:hypothetical protein